MNILVTGAAGYIGAILVPKLLACGHKVTAIDTMWFGSGALSDNGNLSVLKMDVLDVEQDVLNGHDAVIHLASLSNNAMCISEPELSQRINVDGAERIAKLSASAGVQRFIYASSVAAYGSSEEYATEDMELHPETPYGKQKQQAERKVREQFPAAIIARSASVCGYSPNMAFHLTINKMVNDAYREAIITVNGGQQKRCHIHIHDICDAYIVLLNESAAQAETFNFVAANETILESAESVRAVMECSANIDIRPATDDRSYIVDGSKALKLLKFSPRRRINDAIRDIETRFRSNMWADSLTEANYQRVRKAS